MSTFESRHNRHLALVLGPALFVAVTGCKTVYETEYCVSTPAEEGCETDPDAAMEKVEEQMALEECGVNVVEVVGFDHQVDISNDDPDFPRVNCCYVVVAKKRNPNIICGRGLVHGQGSSQAILRLDQEWNRGVTGAVDAVSGSESVNPALGAMWARAGLSEHASVAAFARAAIELMAHGAPASLVDRHVQAARDEVRHATAAFALASTFVGNPVGPGRLPVTAREVPDLAALAAEVTREGCVNETLAACLAAAQRVGATDPAVIAALDEVIRDESAHAALAWETLAWLIGEGGEPVRAAAAEALESALAGVPDLGLFAVEVETAETVTHGGLSEATLGMAARRVLAEVIGPAAREILAG